MRCNTLSGLLEVYRYFGGIHYQHRHVCPDEGGSKLL